MSLAELASLREEAHACFQSGFSRLALQTTPGELGQLHRLVMCVERELEDLEEESALGMDCRRAVRTRKRNLF